MPAIETFKPMTLDFAKAASRVEDVTTRLATILGCEVRADHRDTTGGRRPVCGDSSSVVRL